MTSLLSTTTEQFDLSRPDADDEIAPISGKQLPVRPWNATGLLHFARKASANA
jgi:hypothetical protein